MSRGRIGAIVTGLLLALGCQRDEQGSVEEEVEEMMEPDTDTDSRQGLSGPATRRGFETPGAGELGPAMDMGGTGGAASARGGGGEGGEG